jgi:hypothetical protein
MAASFPGAIKSFVDRTDAVHDVMAADVNDAYAEITAVETELGVDPAGTAADLVTRLARSLSGSGNLDFAAATTLIITGGAVTPTQNWHLVDTQSAAATDDLDTITATNATDGFMLFLRQVHDDRDVTIKHDTGNVKCPGGADVVLTDATQVVSLVYDGATSKWMVISSNQSITAGTGIAITGAGSGTVTVALSAGGWIPANETWTHVSSASPSYTFGTGVDVSGIYSPGMRIKYTDSGSTMFGLVTAVSGSQVTQYGGTDYSMSGSAITSPFYSMVKAPLGFPLDPAKWTEGMYDENTRTQTTPANEGSYAPGALHLHVPSGVWNMRYGADGLNITSGSSGTSWYVSMTYFNGVTPLPSCALTAPGQSMVLDQSVAQSGNTLSLTDPAPLEMYLYYEGDACDSIGTYGAYIYATSAYL